MNWNDVSSALTEAKETLKISDNHVAKMAEITVGRLRAQNVPSPILKALKSELRDFDGTTCKWKKR